MPTDAVLRELARLWNADDLQGYMDLFSPDVVFLSSESWPESGRLQGREAVRSFWDEFHNVWEEVRLVIDEVHPTESAVAARCHWVTRGRASGVEGELEFALVLWPEEGIVVRGQFFDELPTALAAVGLGDRDRG